MVVKVVIVFFISVNSCFSSATGQILPATGCLSGPENEFIIGKSSISNPTDINANPRYTRAILGENKRIPRNSKLEKFRFPREINQNEYNQDQAYSRMMQTGQPNTFSPHGNFGYNKPDRDDLKEQNNGQSRFYQAYDGSFGHPNPNLHFPPGDELKEQINGGPYRRPPYTTYGSLLSHSQPQYHPISNPADSPTHVFGGRCPYCNSMLQEPVYQQQMVNPRYNQFQQNQRGSPFQQQQFPTMQEQVGYQNVNAATKTAPTSPSEEMCPYDSSPQHVMESTPGRVFNQTVLQVPDVRDPVNGNPPPQLAVKAGKGVIVPNNVKAGANQQAYKYMKMQKNEGVPKNMGSK